ncbi:MAG: nucleotidyltransferase family protein [Bacteroidales bacterium]|nr:nucleotidyltransferase family protein [Bacteroidales bacterium]
MNLNKCHSDLIALLSNSIANICLSNTQEGLNVNSLREGWQEIYSQSAKQGIHNLIFTTLPKVEQSDQLELNFSSESDTPSLVKYGVLNIATVAPPYDICRKWEQDLEDNKVVFSKQREVISELIKYLKEKDIRTLLLSSIAISRFYPDPSARFCGDIDLYLFKNYDSGIKLIERLGITVDRVNSGFCRFIFRGVNIRFHKSFLFSQFRNRPYTRSDKRISKELISLLKEDSISVKGDDGVLIDVPGPNFMALYIIRYTVLHFLEYGLFLRHLCDLILFFQENSERIDFVKLKKILREYKQYKLFCSIIEICKVYLGFKPDFATKDHPRLTKRVLEDIFLNRYRVTDRKKIKNMHRAGRYLLDIKYLLSSGWKYRAIDPLLYMKVLPYKLL